MRSSLFYKYLFISLLLIPLLFISIQVFGQVSLQWEKFYGNSLKYNDQVRDMVADDLGNVYVTGISAGINNKPDYLTIKYNRSGEQQWVARYDGTGRNDEVQAIAMDKSGNIYVTGYSENDAESYDFATIKYNNAGVQQWVARFNGPGNGFDWAFDLKVDKEGNVYVSGFATVLGPSSDCAVVKYNSEGVLQWARYYDGTGHGSDVAFAMALDSVTSDIYVTGNTTSENYNEDYITIKYNSAGVEQWAIPYNGTGNTIDDGRVIAVDSHSNVYVSGISRAPGNVYDCTTIKYSGSGVMNWIQRYSGPAHNICQANAMIVDKHDNIYITGFTIDNQNHLFCATLKYNSAGSQQWVQLYSGIPGGDNVGWAIALDGQDNIYIAGQSSGGSTSFDYITLKYNPDGVQQWAQRYDVSKLINVASTIAVNKFNEVYVSGSVRTYADASGDYYDYATIKYNQAIPLVVTARPDTTVYYGFGSNCVQLETQVSGGVEPYTFSWSPGGTTPNNATTTVCPTSTSAYTVTVKDATGTIQAAQATVKVIDVRCGNDAKKVLLCHNGKELCIAQSAVPAHLQHGDILGGCSDNSKNSNNRKDISIENSIAPSLFKAYPNPFYDKSNIIYWLPIDAEVNMTLLDVNGRELTTILQEKKSAGSYVTAITARNLAPGTYLCRMITKTLSGQSVRILKLVVKR